MASNCLLVLALWSTCAVSIGAEHHGTVKSNGLPVPGATVTATQSDKELVTTTDEQGAYAFPDLSDGVWTIAVEMFGFTKISREVGIAPNAPSPEWELKVGSLTPVQQAQTAAAMPKPSAPAPAAASQPGPATSRNRQGAGVPSAQGRGGQNGQGRPSLNQALARNSYQRLGVNASGNTDGAENAQNGSAPNEFGQADLNQSASDALIVNGSV